MVERDLTETIKAFYEQTPFSNYDGVVVLEAGYCTGLKMTNDAFAELFGVTVRKPEDRLEQIHMDLAASVQWVTEEAIVRLACALGSETGARILCLAGGVALNCVANGKLLRDRYFDNAWVQPEGMRAVC
jgi:carbamoyltransferase